MSRTNKRKFTRPVATREYRKVITIFPEGEKTEHSYFTILRTMVEAVNVIIKKGDKKTQPNQVLYRAKKYIKDNGLSKNEQIWLVIDVDGRPKNSFGECLEWEKTNDKYNVAISNPKFEYWLLLHFDDGSGITTSSECTNKLKVYLKDFEKNHLNPSKITKSECLTAIKNARVRDSNHQNWHDYYSNVYKLLLEVLDSV